MSASEVIRPALTRRATNGMEKALKTNIVELPSVQGKTQYLLKLDLFVMDVLTDSIGFERGTYALHAAEYRFVGDIIASCQDEIAKVPGMSPWKLKKIKSFLTKHGLDYGLDTAEWQIYKARKDTVPPYRPRPGQPAFPRLAT